MKSGRGVITGLGATAAAVSLLAFGAGPAVAGPVSESVVSYDSPKHGWASAQAYVSVDGVFLDVCDGGDPDGRRAVGYLYFGSTKVMTAQATGGSGSCSPPRTSLGWSRGAGWFTVMACTRDGADGRDQGCNSWPFYFDGEL
ncbi:hypothetical protein [Streptomyces griseus]|uniref:hypothetical protein n=1 Tax=Streptomyces griseus TaxID=1911 RepID=UPI0005670169|nr:hypothetical protein [Streptomyces griseus]